MRRDQNGENFNSKVTDLSKSNFIIMIKTKIYIYIFFQINIIKIKVRLLNFWNY